MKGTTGQLETLERDDWDVLVVGGGIVGAGVVRDAAMRGLRAALIEQHDFAFGTSSRSSRLLHGGLRYLAQGRIRLVQEASKEKCVLHRIAPHLANPLPFLFPTYQHTRWPRWKLSIGVRIYDLLCGQRNLGPSNTLSVREILETLPHLGTEKLTGAVRYFDGFTSDARLVLDTLRSAVKHGGAVHNYLTFTDAQRTTSGWACHAVDGATNQKIHIKTRTLVNATGCWANCMPHSAINLRLTKGVHLVLDQARFPISEAVVMVDGQRILFAIPWGERVIIGTTDTDYDGSLENVPTTSEDVTYLLEVTNRTFPDARLSPSDVLSHWAGVRPLVASRRNRKGTPSNTSRSHQIRMPQPGWIDVAGGKLTTYRLMAQQTVDRIGKFLELQLAECRTVQEPLVDSSEAEGISSTVPPPVSREAVTHYCHNEWATHLDDVMLRRTSWHYYHQDALSIASQTATWMADLLGWDADRHEAELERFRRVSSGIFVSI